MKTNSNPAARGYNAVPAAIASNPPARPEKKSVPEPPKTPPPPLPVKKK
jgi:hypothetical protein